MSAIQMAEIFRSLQPADLRILLGTELGMASHQYVPISRIVRYANLLEEEIKKRLPDLIDKRLLTTGSMRTLKYAGYRLTFLGYDCLALNAFVKRGVVEALGSPLGLGKESDVYDAKGRKDARIALKFHRLGRISFRQTRRTRGYVAQRAHTSWIYQARMAATREFAAMKRARRAGVPVPRPIGQNRHLVAMGMFEGSELSKVSLLPQPAITLRRTLLKLRLLFCEAHLVHGDLSEYNILLANSGKFVFIDWPQSVATSDPRAGQLLTRDISNVARFFARRYKVSVPVQEALDFVRGKKRDLGRIRTEKPGPSPCRETRMHLLRR
jgi:RIO kinase 2